MKEGIEFRLDESAYGDRIWVNPEHIDMIVSKGEGCVIISNGEHWTLKESYAVAVRRVRASIALDALDEDRL